MVKMSKCCTDAYSWLLGFQLIKWSFCKPIDCYSCRFSIQGTSVERAYSELMRKVLIKLAICSIAFINGEIALFCCWSYHCCHLLLLWVSLKQFPFQHSPRLSSCLFQACTLIFLARTAECLQCLLRKISFWRSMSVLNATMSSILPWGYRSSNAAKTYSFFSSI